MEYTPKEVKKGYTDKSLHIDLSKMSIAEKDIPQKVKEIFIGGKGYDLWTAPSIMVPFNHHYRRRLRLTPTAKIYLLTVRGNYTIEFTFFCRYYSRCKNRWFRSGRCLTKVRSGWKGFVCIIQTGKLNEC